MSNNQGQSGRQLSLPSDKPLLGKKLSASKLKDAAQTLKGPEFKGKAVAAAQMEKQNTWDPFTKSSAELKKQLGAAATAADAAGRTSIGSAGQTSIGSNLTSLTQPGFADPTSRYWDGNSIANSDGRSDTRSSEGHGVALGGQPALRGPGSSSIFHGGGFQNPVTYPTTPVHYAHNSGQASSYSSFPTGTAANKVATPGAYHATPAMASQNMGHLAYPADAQTHIRPTPTVVATPTPVQTTTYKAGKHLPNFVLDQTKGSFKVTLASMNQPVHVFRNASGEMAYRASDNKWYQVVAWR
ncbi:hypothetical protein AURDEDRAFT_148331 [Auricularia subglabra TFB-10046 SS5]|nr:hypothetical protein AURDEDRAFT_148331 [Auricularia subglabra TFB-10046 SS5]